MEQMWNLSFHQFHSVFFLLLRRMRSVRSFRWYSFDCAHLPFYRCTIPNNNKWKVSFVAIFSSVIKEKGIMISDGDDAHVMQNDMKYRNVSWHWIKKRAQGGNELQIEHKRKKNVNEHTRDYEIHSRNGSERERALSLLLTKWIKYWKMNGFGCVIPLMVWCWICGEKKRALPYSDVICIVCDVRACMSVCHIRCTCSFFFASGAADVPTHHPISFLLLPFPPYHTYFNLIVLIFVFA